MAKTGKSYVNITPGLQGAGQPEVRYINESSSMSGLRGAPVVNTAGNITELAANGVLIYGFLAEAGNSASATGLNDIGIYRARLGTQFAGTLKATLTAAMIGSIANLVKGSSTWYLDTSTSISSVAQVYIEDVAEGFEIGDTQPIVYFTLIQSMIEETA